MAFVVCCVISFICMTLGSYMIFQASSCALFLCRLICVSPQTSFQHDADIFSGKGCVYSFDPVGSYEREPYRAGGSSSSMLQPLLDNQVLLNIFSFF